jgi:hypothetical protein
MRPTGRALFQHKDTDVTHHDLIDTRMILVSTAAVQNFFNFPAGCRNSLDAVMYLRLLISILISAIVRYSLQELVGMVE